MRHVVLSTDLHAHRVDLVAELGIEPLGGRAARRLELGARRVELLERRRRRRRVLEKEVGDEPRQPAVERDDRQPPLQRPELGVELGVRLEVGRREAAVEGVEPVDPDQLLALGRLGRRAQHGGRALPQLPRRAEQLGEQRRVAPHRRRHRARVRAAARRDGRRVVVGAVGAVDLGAGEVDVLEVLLDAAAERRAAHDRLVEVDEQPLELLELRRLGAPPGGRGRVVAVVLVAAVGHRPERAGGSAAASASAIEAELDRLRPHVLHHALVVGPRREQRVVREHHAVERDEQLEQVGERAVRDGEARVLERGLVELLRRVVERRELVHHVHHAPTEERDRNVMSCRHGVGCHCMGCRAPRAGAPCSPRTDTERDGMACHATSCYGMSCHVMAWVVERRERVHHVHHAHA